MQGSKLFVGNLSYNASKEEIEELFGQFGEVRQVNIIEGKGFGFVEMGNQGEAQKAKETLNGTDFKGRNLKVDEALPPKKGPRRGGFKR
jgi:RNA recognition motif-containing protein